MRAFPLAVLLALAAAWAGAVSADDLAAARAGLERERRAIEAVFRQAEADCTGRFAVNSCLEKARSDRRKGLAGVRERELALDDAQRQQRAADRRRAVRDKQNALQERSASSASGVPKVPIEVRAPRSAGPGADVPPGRNAPIDGGPGAAAARASAAAARAQEFEARQARIAERERERAAAGKPVRPLPVPAGPAASAP